MKLGRRGHALDETEAHAAVHTAAAVEADYRRALRTKAVRQILTVYDRHAMGRQPLTADWLSRSLNAGEVLPINKEDLAVSAYSALALLEEADERRKAAAEERSRSEHVFTDAVAFAAANRPPDVGGSLPFSKAGRVYREFSGGVNVGPHTEPAPLKPTWIKAGTLPQLRRYNERQGRVKAARQLDRTLRTQAKLLEETETLVEQIAGRMREPLLMPELGVAAAALRHAGKLAKAGHGS